MKLKEILNICNDFIEEPKNENVAKKYNNMLQSLVVRTYLPMQEKVIALVRMVIDSDKNIDIPETMFTAGLEIACLFDGLISYVNIEPEIDIEIKNYENYDILYKSGFADYVLRFCEKDYDRLVRMMERTLSFQNLFELVSTVKELDTSKITDLKTAIQNAMKDVDPNIIKDFADIMRFNDPSLAKLKEQIETMEI